MKNAAAAVLITLAGVALTLAAMGALVTVSIRVSLIGNPALRALAEVSELVGGSLWLLGTVYLATHFAVLIFRRTAPHKG